MNFDWDFRGNLGFLRFGGVFRNSKGDIERIYVGSMRFSTKITIEILVASSGFKSQLNQNSLS